MTTDVMNEEYFDDEQKKTLREVFDLYNNTTGKKDLITFKEFASAYNYLTGKTWNADQIKQIKQEISELGAEYKDDIGLLIDFDTFCVILGRRMRNSISELVEDIFKHIDVSNNGYIGVKELRHLFKCMGENISNEQAQEMINDADVDKDGEISLDEFKLLLKELGYLQ